MLLGVKRIVLQYHAMSLCARYFLLRSLNCPRGRSANIFENAPKLSTFGVHEISKRFKFIDHTIDAYSPNQNPNLNPNPDPNPNTNPNHNPNPNLKPSPNPNPTLILVPKI